MRTTSFFASGVALYSATLLFAAPCVDPPRAGEFTPGVVGQLYDVVRIDRLNPGQLITPDGILNEPVWARARSHPLPVPLPGGPAPTGPADFCPCWKAVITATNLYIACTIQDDIEVSNQTPGCAAFNDDSKEIYLDFGKERATSYDSNDVQLVISRRQGTVSWYSNGTCLSSSTGSPVIMGSVIEIPGGWQAEACIALNNPGTNGKSWNFTATAGAQLGINVQANDDDVGGSQSTGQVTVQTWSNFGSFNNPTQFGCMMVRDPFVRGDSDGNTRVEFVDGLFTLRSLFARRRGIPRPRCGDAADANDDGRVSLSDVLYTFRWIFFGSAPPPAPFPSCGTDPSLDLLGCVEGCPVS